MRGGRRGLERSCMNGAFVERDLLGLGREKEPRKGEGRCRRAIIMMLCVVRRVASADHFWYYCDWDWPLGIPKRKLNGEVAH